MHINKDQQLIKAFCHHYFWLSIVHHTYKTLFEDTSKHELLEKTAKSFFQNLNKIIIDYLFFQFCKFTDPAKMRNDFNLTVEYMVKYIDWAPDIKDKLSSLMSRLNELRNLIKDARHKIIVHRDVEVIISQNQVLGKFPKGKDEEFLDLLGEFCDCMHRACFGKSFGSISTASEGDVFDLIKTLKKSIAFERLLSEKSGDDLIKLYDLMK